MDVVLVYCSYCSAWVEVALELLEAITSANVIAVMLNVFGNLRWQRLVPFVDRQVPGRLSVGSNSSIELCNSQSCILTRHSKHVSVRDFSVTTCCTVFANNLGDVCRVY